MMIFRDDIRHGRVYRDRRVRAWPAPTAAGGLVHAFPAVTNVPSNGICRSVGFRPVEELDIPFAGRILRSGRWIIDPRRIPP